MNTNLFFTVLEPVALTYAVASGVMAGSTVLLWLSLRIPPLRPLKTWQYALLASGTIGFLFGVFFAGQITQAYLTDPNWPRALARGCLAEVFSVACGVGLGIARSFAHERTRDA